MSEEKSIVLSSGGDFLIPAAALNTVLATYQAKKEFIGKVLAPGIDYGTIPGSVKPALYKPGAEKMASFFGLSPIFEDVSTAEDWTGADHGGEPFFYYRQKCKLHRGDRMIASADGSCNSWETKYRYRSSNRKCPKCGKETIIAGKQEYGGGWLCFAKKGGCGAKFKVGDATIEGQQVGQVKNLDVADLTNTILKMAQKRALVAAVLIATNASDYFTQDMDDFAVDAQFTDVAVESVNPAPKAPVMAQEARTATETEKPPQDVAYTLSLEEALEITNSNGVRYGDMPSGVLSTMRKSITNKINAMAEANQDYSEYTRKMQAIDVILASKK